MYLSTSTVHDPNPAVCVATLRKGPYVGKIKIELCMACSRGHSAGRFDTKIRCLAQFLMELLRIL